MRIPNISALTVTVLLLSACAVCRPTQEPTQDYVEVENPTYTMSPNTAPTMFVPRRYVEEGIPRGKTLIKQGFDAGMGSKQETSSERQLGVPTP